MNEMRRNEEHDPLDEAPVLRGLKGGADPLVVPDGFFERFPHEVQAKVVARRPTLTVLWVKRLAWSLGLIAVVLAVWFALPQTQDTSLTPQELALDVHPEELPVQTHLVWDVYADDEVALFGEVLLDLEEHEMIAYLERENVNVELLMLEL